MNSKKFGILYVIVLLVFFVFLFRATIPKDRFDYDGSDYMYASSKGFLANYLDKSSIPLWTFIHEGLNQGTDRSRRDDLSDYIRKSGDLSFYRHYHGPLFFYWLSLGRQVVGDNEYLIRWASFFWHGISFIVIYAGCFFILRERRGVISALASCLFLFSPINILTSVRLTPQSMYLSICLITLFLIAQMIQLRSLKYGYLSVVALSIAFATFEYAAILLVTFLFCIIFKWKLLTETIGKYRLIHFLLISVVIFLLVTVVIWPGGLIQLSMIRNYLFLLYIGFVRRPEWDLPSVIDIWWHRIEKSPFEYVFIILFSIIFLYQFFKYRKNQWALPFLIYPAVLFVTTLLNRLPNPKYISSLLPCLYIISASALGPIIRSKSTIFKMAVLILLTGMVLLNNRIYFEKYRAYSRPNRSAVVDYFASGNFDRKTILVSRQYGSLINFYFPRIQVTSYADSTSVEKIIEKISTNKYEGLLYQGQEASLLQRQLATQFHVKTKVVLKWKNSDLMLVYYHLKKYDTFLE